MSSYPDNGATSDMKSRLKVDQNFMRLFEASPAPFLVLAIDAPRFTISEVNDAYLAATARNRKDIIGQSVFEAFPDNPDDPTVKGVDVLRASLERVLATREPDTLPGLRYDVAPTGGRFEERWWSPVNSPVIGENGEVEAIIHNANDVTEERRVTAALRESEARLKLALEAGRLAEVTFDFPDGVVHSSAFAELLGHPRDKRLTLAEFRAQYHPKDHDRILEERAAILAGSQTFFEIEKRIVRPDGQIRWVYGRGGVQRDSRGQATSVTAVYLDETDRKLAEAALAESEKRFRNVADGAPVMMWVTDPSGNCTYLNKRWYEYTGQELGAGEGYGWLSAVHPDDYSVAEQAFLKANAEQHDYRVDFRLRRADGAFRWAIDAAAARFAEDGEYLGYVGSVIDIDERREAELALEASEERLRLATEHAEIGFWDVDLVQDILIWPPRVKAMFGISPDVPVAMADFYEGLHPEDQEQTAGAFRDACDPTLQALYEVEYRTVGKEDGQLRWVAARGRGIFDKDRCVRVVGIAIDITARKLTEIALQESEARVRALTDNLPSGMVYQLWTGPDGEGRKFLYVSQSHEQLTGVTAEAVLEDPTLPYKLLLPADLVDLAFAEAKAIRENCAFDAEARFRRLDGKVRWSRIISAPRPQADGSTIWDGIQIDITEHKEAEAELRELNDNLEQRVAEEVSRRSSAEDALRQSQKLEAMGQLTGGVAHDFNNLLTPIVGSLDMLQRKGLGNERDQRLIEGAIQSAERARTLVQRLLAFARRQPLQPVPVDVKQVIDGMADLISSTTGPQVKVVVEVSDNLPPAVADPNQLEMALLNLAVNARDAMPSGGILRLSAGVADVHTGGSDLGPGRYITLSVADTGVGMDEATLKRAIEPFFSTKGLGKGTGLGLSMVHGLALQLGGTLRMRSRPEVGTNVELWLPVTSAKVVKATGRTDGFDERGRHGTVLLVDDEDLVRETTAAMLSDLGFSVVEACSGEEALSLLNNGLIASLLVTDHLMPGMNGTELARFVKETSPATYVLIISGYAGVEGVAPDLPRLTKPFRQEQLAAMLPENLAI
jgi:PAS domain S-box-containing protein